MGTSRSQVVFMSNDLPIADLQASRTVFQADMSGCCKNMMIALGLDSLLIMSGRLLLC
jgi:hypothetical protein